MSAKRTYGFRLSYGKGDNYSPGLDWLSKFSVNYGLYPTDNLNIDFKYSHEDEAQWLNWISENKLATFDKKQRRTNVSLKWFKANKHELRVKAQMVAFTARKPKPYLATFNGKLIKSNHQVSPFTLSELAFQVRYRYEIMPLAYFYLVYTKGGRVYEEDEEDDLGKIYKRPWEDPTSDTFTIKVRYKF